MGRGSPLCAKLHEIIVSQFKDNVSQRKISNNLGLSLSTVHNIVKRFRESGEILVHKGQGQKPLLNEHVHWALRRYCLRNRHATMMDIVTWAWEYFGKSLSLNTALRCVKKIQLEMVLLILDRHAAKFSGPEGIWNWLKDSGNVFSGQMSPHFSLFFGKTDVGFYVPKMKRPDCYQRKVQKPASVMVWGCISAHGMGDLHICEGTIDVEANVGILERCQDELSSKHASVPTFFECVAGIF